MPSDQLCVLKTKIMVQLLLQTEAQHQGLRAVHQPFIAPIEELTFRRWEEMTFCMVRWIARPVFVCVGLSADKRRGVLGMV